MERIVLGISKINFESNSEDAPIENLNLPTSLCAAAKSSTPGAAVQALNLFINCPTRLQLYDAMSNTTATTSTAETETDFAAVDQIDAKLSFTNVEADFSDKDDDDENDEEDEQEQSNVAAHSRMTKLPRSTPNFMQSRHMPTRAAKENSLLRTSRRTIMKPSKKAISSSSTEVLSNAEIRKIYMKKSLKKFRPTNLETIFEEPKSDKNLTNIAGGGIIDCSAQLRFTGIKKLRRSLSCSDGLTVNKALIKQRRAKIKKTFGKPFALKKIALTEFLEHLNKRIEENASEITTSSATSTATTSNTEHNNAGQSGAQTMQDPQHMIE